MERGTRRRPNRDYNSQVERMSQLVIPVFSQVRDWIAVIVHHDSLS